MTSKHQCKTCSQYMDFTVSVHMAGHSMTPGDWCMCYGCGTIAIFDDQLNMRAATDQELKEFQNNEPQVYNAVMKIQKTISRSIQNN